MPKGRLVFCVVSLFCVLWPILSVLIVSLCVFTFLALCCDVRYDFRLKGISLVTATSIWFSYKKQKLFSIREHLDSPEFGGFCIAHLSSFLCCLLFCLSLSCVLCTQCCQFLWIVHSWLPLRISITFTTLIYLCLYILKIFQSILVSHGLRGTQEVL